MGSEVGILEVEKPHAILIPYPAQGHVKPMLKLAKLLHSKGFYITYVNTEFNHNRLLRSRGPHSLDGLDDFRFEAIPDVTIGEMELIGAHWDSCLIRGHLDG
ncbi:hypothetical protein ACLOJK_013419 [Asimina triloba]